MEKKNRKPQEEQRSSETIQESGDPLDDFFCCADKDLLTINPSPRILEAPLQPEILPQPLPSKSSISPWNIRFYKEYFNLSTQTVLRRCIHALWPFNKTKFLELVGGNHDLYVPIWVCITLIISLNVFAYISGGINSNYTPSALKVIPFNGEKVYKTTTFIVGMLTLNPLLFYFLLKTRGADIPYPQLLSLYAYSFIVFIPLSLLYIIPYAIFRLGLLCAGAYISLSFMNSNLGYLSQMFMGNYWDKVIKFYFLVCHSIFCLFIHIYIYV